MRGTSGTFIGPPHNGPFSRAGRAPARRKWPGGVWSAIRQGVRGVPVGDERGVMRVYVIREPASRYYDVMTRSAWTPVLIGERI